MTEEDRPFAFKRGQRVLVKERYGDGFLRGVVKEQHALREGQHAYAIETEGTGHRGMPSEDMYGESFVQPEPIATSIAKPAIGTKKTA